MHPPLTRTRSLALFILLMAAIAFVAAIWTHRHPSTASATAAAAADRPFPSAPAGPPWRYGRPDARFTVVEYADLECPFCRAYFPVLKRWIDGHPEVNWQWQHLPLSMHEPAASVEAQLVECVGKTQGQDAFWQAVEWVYTRTRGDGQGVPEGSRYPDLTPATQQCLDGDEATTVIHAQASTAARDGVTATPTLRLEDHASGRTLLLHGPAEGDALLSAIDWLAAGGDGGTAAASSPAKEMPADPVGDMPR